MIRSSGPSLHESARISHGFPVHPPPPRVRSSRKAAASPTSPQRSAPARVHVCLDKPTGTLCSTPERREDPILRVAPAASLTHHDAENSLRTDQTSLLSLHKAFRR